ncbi:MAG: ABC-type Fe3+-hydroxamate transport system, periplasmic component [Bacteroidota bacterium]|nr:ABC-type Fe3+-hydroxamate transport system, periplasmic component [Bacteroidota bacterium]
MSFYVANMQYYSEISDMLFTDQLNSAIELDEYPTRIVSLVPSQSELLWDLGLREELVGITKFCIHPKELFNTVKRVGGTKTLHLDVIRDLQPDLIIGNKEENEFSQITELQKEFKVWMSDIYNLNDSMDMIRSIGKVVNRESKANHIALDIEQSFLGLKQVRKKALYLIWKPYMAAGRSTFIGDMLHRIGLENVLDDPNGRYPDLSMDEIKNLNPEILLLSSEPFPFKEQHMEELRGQLPYTKILLVDGELFSWYGSRLKKSADYFNTLNF